MRVTRCVGAEAGRTVTQTERDTEESRSQCGQRICFDRVSHIAIAIAIAIVICAGAGAGVEIGVGMA